MTSSTGSRHALSFSRPTAYTRLAIALHWLLAAGLVYQIGLGFWMGDIPKAPPGLRAEWFNWHKSTGMVLALFIVLRVVWRMHHRAPALPLKLPCWQTSVARASHALMYAYMVAMPLTGFLGSSFTPNPIMVFGTPLPQWWGASSELKAFFSLLHNTISYLFVLALAAHILAALWHACRRDGVFSRMLPG